MVTINKNTTIFLCKLSMLLQTFHVANKQAVNFGVEILKIVPGRVSTEVDARYEKLTLVYYFYADLINGVNLTSYSYSSPTHP